MTRTTAARRLTEMFAFKRQIEIAHRWIHMLLWQTRPDIIHITNRRTQWADRKKSLTSDFGKITLYITYVVVQLRILCCFIPISDLGQFIKHYAAVKIVLYCKGLHRGLYCNTTKYVVCFTVVLLCLILRFIEHERAP